MAKVLSGGRISQASNELSTPARALGGAYTRLLGAPANVIQSGANLLGLPIQGIRALESKISPLPFSLLGPDISQGLSQIAPTSENLVNWAQQLTGKSLEPQSIPESLVQRLPQLGAELGLGSTIGGALGAGGTTAMDLLKQVGKAGLGQAGAEALGFSPETGQIAGLIGPSIVGGIKNFPRALESKAGQFYGSMEKAAEKIKPIKSRNTFAKLAEIETKASKKLSDASREPINEAIRYVGEAINPKTAEASVEGLIGSYQKINDLLASGNIPRNALPSILEIKNDVIPNLLKAENPSFAHLFETANKAYATAKGQTVLEKIIPESFKFLTSKKGIAALNPLTYGALGLFGYPLTLPMMTKIGLGSVALPGINAVLRRIEPLAKSAELRKIAKDLSLAGAKNNAQAFANSVVKLDQLLTKKEPNIQNKGAVLSGGRLQK